MKVCKRCGKNKEKTEYYKHSGCKDGIRPECKACYGERNKKLYKFRKKDYYNNMYLKKYGITIEDRDLMLAKQDNKCAICKSPHPNRKNTRSFCVDHNHETGKVRGLLCQSCNRGLGLLKDDKEILLRAVRYLEMNDG